MFNIILALASLSLLGFICLKTGLIGVAGVIALCGVVRLICR
jgi:hypothetical protein